MVCIIIKDSLPKSCKIQNTEQFGTKNTTHGDNNTSQEDFLTQSLGKFQSMEHTVTKSTTYGDNNTSLKDPLTQSSGEIPQPSKILQPSQPGKIQAMEHTATKNTTHGDNNTSQKDPFTQSPDKIQSMEHAATKDTTQRDNEGSQKDPPEQCSDNELSLKIDLALTEIQEQNYINQGRKILTQGSRTILPFFLPKDNSWEVRLTEPPRKIKFIDLKDKVFHRNTAENVKIPSINSCKSNKPLEDNSNQRTKTSSESETELPEMWKKLEEELSILSKYRKQNSEKSRNHTSYKEAKTNGETLKRQGNPIPSSAKTLQTSEKILEERDPYQNSAMSAQKDCEISIQDDLSPKTQQTNENTLEKRDDPYKNSAMSPQTDDKISKQVDQSPSSPKTPQTNEENLEEECDAFQNSAMSPQTDDKIPKHDYPSPSSSKRTKTNEETLKEQDQNSAKRRRTDTKTLEQENTLTPSSANRQALGERNDKSQNSEKSSQINRQTSRYGRFLSSAKKPRTSEEALDEGDGVFQKSAKRSRTNDETSKLHDLSPSLTKRPKTNEETLEQKDSLIPSSENRQTNDEALRPRVKSQNSARSSQTNNKISKQQKDDSSLSSVKSPLINDATAKEISSIQNSRKDGTKIDDSNIKLSRPRRTVLDGVISVYFGPELVEVEEYPLPFYPSNTFVEYLYVDYVIRHQGQNVYIACDSIEKTETGFISIYQILKENGVDLSKWPFPSQRIMEIEKVLALSSYRLTQFLRRPREASKKELDRILKTIRQPEKDYIVNLRDSKNSRIDSKNDKSVSKVPKKRVRFSDDCIDDSNNPKIRKIDADCSRKSKRIRRASDKLLEVS